MKLGMNHPMGPLRLADLIGLDVCLDIMKVLFEGFRDSKYRPCPLLVKMVDAGFWDERAGADSTIISTPSKLGRYKPVEPDCSVTVRRKQS